MHLVGMNMYINVHGQILNKLPDEGAYLYVPTLYSQNDDLFLLWTVQSRNKSSFCEYNLSGQTKMKVFKAILYISI